jgi:hypothetical protein
MVEKQRDAIAAAVPTKRGHAASKSGAVTANRAHGACRALQWAIKNGYVTGVNPTDNIDPLIEHSRSRVLLDPELTVIGQEAGNDVLWPRHQAVDAHGLPP